MSTPSQQLGDQFAGALRGTGHPATLSWLLAEGAGELLGTDVFTGFRNTLRPLIEAV